jgi:(2Fe-2S) ferredoxin
MGKKTSFELTGQFQGYQFSDRGILSEIRLETAQGLREIRLTKACQLELWQSALNQQMRLGDWLLVRGEMSYKKAGVIYRAARIAPMLPVMESALSEIAGDRDGSSASISELPKNNPTKILVCQKSSCRKRGSQEVQRCLEKTLHEYGVAEQSKIKETGCLKDCSKGPNLVIGKTHYRKVSKKDVARLVSQHFKSGLPTVPSYVDTKTVIMR